MLVDSGIIHNEDTLRVGRAARIWIAERQYFKFEEVFKLLLVSITLKYLVGQDTFGSKY